MKHYPPLESSDIEDMWDGLDQQIITMEQIMDLGVAGLSGAGGILIGGTVLPRIPVIGEDPRMKAGAAIVLGLVGGRLLWDVSREAALGLAGGLTGLGIASMVGQFAGIDTSLSDIGETPLSQTTVVTSEAEELLGDLTPEDIAATDSPDILAIGEGNDLGAGPTVTTQDVIPVELEDPVIETEQERLLGAWLGG